MLSILIRKRCKSLPWCVPLTFVAGVHGVSPNQFCVYSHQFRRILITGCLSLSDAESGLRNFVGLPGETLTQRQKAEISLRLENMM